MKEYNTELSPIQQLAQNTIHNIEKAYNARLIPVSEHRIFALQQLKKSLTCSDMGLVMDYYGIYFTQKYSPGVLSIKHSVLCKELAFFLFQAKECYLKEYNRITGIILDRLSYKENYEKKWKALCQEQDLFSKKAVMDKEIAVFFQIDFGNCLGVFKEAILQQFGCHDFTLIRPETIMDIFVKAYENNDTSLLRDMLASQAVNNRIEEHWCVKNLYEGFKYTFVQIFAKSNKETKQYIFSSPLFCNYIEPQWLQKHLRNKSIDCERAYQLSLLPVKGINHSVFIYHNALEAIRLCLDIYGHRLDKQWLKENAQSETYHPALKKIYSNAPHNSLGFYQYLYFFWKDSKNVCSLPRDVEQILKKNFIEAALKQEKMHSVPKIV